MSHTDRPDSLLLRRALRRLYLQAGLTADEAASLLGVDRAILSRAGSGQRRPFGPYALSRAFGVTPEEALAPCLHCSYQPPPGYACLLCGSSQDDPYTCPSCSHTAGTASEMRYHAGAAHQAPAPGQPPRLQGEHGPGDPAAVLRAAARGGRAVSAARLAAVYGWPAVQAVLDGGHFQPLPGRPDLLAIAPSGRRHLLAGARTEQPPGREPA